MKTWARVRATARYMNRNKSRAPSKSVKVSVYGWPYALTVYSKHLELWPIEFEDSLPFFYVCDHIAEWRQFIPDERDSISYTTKLPPGIFAFAPDGNGGHFKPHGFWFAKMEQFYCSLVTLEDDDLPIAKVLWFKSVEEPQRRVRELTKDQPILQVDWEILPPGYDPLQDSMFFHRPSREENPAQQLLLERLDFLGQLNPIRWYRGILLEGTREYRVAEFERHMIAECPLFGNAAFVVPKSNWKLLLSHDKAYAKQHGAVDIRHRGQWQDRIRRAIGR